MHEYHTTSGGLGRPDVPSGGSWDGALGHAWDVRREGRNYLVFVHSLYLSLFLSSFFKYFEVTECVFFLRSDWKNTNSTT